MKKPAHIIDLPFAKVADYFLADARLHRALEATPPETVRVHQRGDAWTMTANFTTPEGYVFRHRVRWTMSFPGEGRR